MTKKLLISVLLASGLSIPVFAEQEQEQDLNKVNQVIKTITSSAIRGDAYFKRFTVEIDAQNTDLKAGEGYASAEAIVGATAWSGLPTAVGVSGSFAKTGEVIKQVPSQDPNGPPVSETYAQGDLALGASLQTEVLPMVKYLWALSGLCTDEVTPDSKENVYKFVSAKLCPTVNVGLENAATIYDLVALAQTLKADSLTVISEYVVVKEVELSETQDESKKKQILAQIEDAKEFNSEIEAVELTPTKSGMSIKANVGNFGAGPIFLELNVASIRADISFKTVFEMAQDSFAEWLDVAHQTLLEIQKNEKSTVDELTDTLKGYLEMVKDFTKAQE